MNNVVVALIFSLATRVKLLVAVFVFTCMAFAGSVHFLLALRGLIK